MARRKDPKSGKARRRTAQPEPGEWHYTVGDVPLRLQAYERTDRGFAIYTRVWDGKRYKEKRHLCDPIRNGDGSIDPELETAAQRAALDRYRRLKSGQPIAPANGGPLTLEAGFKRLLDPREGKWTRSAERRKEVTQISHIVLAVLGRDLAWQDLKQAHYRKLWRTMAEQHRDGGAYGVRATEIVISSLQTAAVWLAREELVERSAVAAKGWKDTLRQEWTDITGRPPGPPAKPRYNRVESAALWEALPKADPRLVLAFELGAELRLGQLPRSRRSDILPHRGLRIGRVVVHGRGKKKGVVLVLSMTQRHALTRAMTSGYLAPLEAAYRAGEITDYYLITGGRLRRTKDRRGQPVRVAQVKNASRQLDKSALRTFWYELEELAGVAHLKGRNWYGIRRRASDDAEDVESDARVLNRAGGWTHTATREGYQEEGRVELDEQAKEVREKIRPKRSYRRKLHTRGRPL